MVLNRHVGFSTLGIDIQKIAAGYASVPVKVPQGRFISSCDGWIGGCESLEQWAEVGYRYPAVGVCCKKHHREPGRRCKEVVAQDLRQVRRSWSGGILQIPRCQKEKLTNYWSLKKHD